MLDGSQLYPGGFHPTVPSLTRTATGVAKSLRRCDVEGVVYYVTDFGISTRFTDPKQPRLVRGNDCQDKEVPELSQWTEYDPFPVDIFTLGNVFKKQLLKVRRSIPKEALINEIRSYTPTYLFSNPWC